MSSTSNVQNLLTNVFRPIFVYDTTNGVYQSKLELTNVDSVSANTVYTFSAAVGDASGNVYVGIGSGNPNSLLAIKANSNTTFIGTSAGSGSSSITESVFIGYRAGVSAVSSSYSVSIGAASKSAGNSNVFIGYGTGVTSGSNNIFIGTNVTNTGTVNNKLLIGSGSSASLMVGDLSNNRIGVNLSSLSDYRNDTCLTVNGFTRIGGITNNGKIGINTDPVSYTLDVNGNQRISNANTSMIFTNGRLGINNVGEAAYTLDVTGNQRISNANGYMIFTAGSLSVSNASGSLNLIGNKIGINTIPTTYNLELAGNQQINDGTGTLTFTGGIQTSTGGFRSVSGSFTSIGSETFSVSIGSWKKGNVLISTRLSDNNQYVSSMYFCANETTPTIVFMSGVSNSPVTNYPSLTIVGNTTNINISNSGTSTPGGTYYYSITYFPVS